MIDAAVLPKPRASRPQSRRSAIALALAGCAALAALATNPLHPLVLLNTTPSEPPGLYAAMPAPIRVGAIVAFKAPAAAFPYADLRLGYLHRTPMLKAVAAGPGDRVCAATGRLVINGQDRAPIVAKDRDELFVFSARVPNSFDSRYFGPVAKDAVVGVFQLITPGEGRA
jgi:type IV secretory pathway protease TraF